MEDGLHIKTVDRRIGRNSRIRYVPIWHGADGRERNDAAHKETGSMDVKFPVHHEQA